MDDMKEMIDCRMAACENHPKQHEIFYLEKMLLEAGYPYFFNFWEDLRPTPFEPEKDPEKDIDWEHYYFNIQINREAMAPVPDLSIEVSENGKLILNDFGDAIKAGLTGKDMIEARVIHNDITAEQAMEIIEKFLSSKPMLTYGDLREEAGSRISGEIRDYKPASGMFIPGMDEAEEIPEAIICWLKDGSRMIYIKAPEKA